MWRLGSGDWRAFFSRSLDEALPVRQFLAAHAGANERHEAASHVAGRKEREHLFKVQYL